MNSDLTSTLGVLEREYEEAERNANQLLATINYLRSKSGLPPFNRGGGGAGGGEPSGGGAPTLTHIKPDTFYGKKLQTAMREYLEMRRAQGLGPAKPREIYDAITAGGYQFEAGSPDVALVGLRALLRKRTQFFHKLPNGTYGLTSWYPNARQPKPSHATAEGAKVDDLADTDADDDTDDADDELETETATPSKDGAAVA